MGKFGLTALRAAELVKSKTYSPLDAWNKVASDVFFDTPKNMVKVCPREAFLGLCVAGLLKGINSDSMSQIDSPNRNYAITAVQLLLAKPELANSSNAKLWREVLRVLGADPVKTHNQQMDVVLSLWSQGYINGWPA